MKTKTWIFIASGFSTLLVGVAFLIYMNLSKVENSNAANPSDRIILPFKLQSDMTVKEISISPKDQQPADRNNAGIKNKRKAEVIQH